MKILLQSIRFPNYGFMLPSAGATLPRSRTRWLPCLRRGSSHLACACLVLFVKDWGGVLEETRPLPKGHLMRVALRWRICCANNPIMLKLSAYLECPTPRLAG